MTQYSYWGNEGMNIYDPSELTQQSFTFEDYAASAFILQTAYDYVNYLNSSDDSLNELENDFFGNYYNLEQFWNNVPGKNVGFSSLPNSTVSDALNLQALIFLYNSEPSSGYDFADYLLYQILA